MKHKIQQHNHNTIYCNCCARALKNEKGALREDVVHVVKHWGYFSDKDLENHEFLLCEECYDKITSAFRIPVDVKWMKEVL